MSHLLAIHIHRSSGDADFGVGRVGYIDKIRDSEGKVRVLWDNRRAAMHQVRGSGQSAVGVDSE